MYFQVPCYYDKSEDVKRLKTPKEKQPLTVLIIFACSWCDGILNELHEYAGLHN
jgi:hypothetical protein